MVLSIILGILLLGILVVVHEWGHFITARLCGIEVKEFSVGFGPKLLSRVGRRGCRYSLRLIPLGGYCMFYDEMGTEAAENPGGEADSRSFPLQKLWKRMLTILMGPVMNFALAFLVLFFIMVFTGVYAIQPGILEVTPGGPAMEAGLMAGDQILEVDGRDMSGRSLDPFLEAVRDYSGSGSLSFRVLRGGEILTLPVTPAWDGEQQAYRTGVVVRGAMAVKPEADGTLTGVMIRMSLWENIAYTWNYCVRSGGLILESLKKLVTTGEGLEETSGPVGVVSLVSQEVQRGGLPVFFDLLVIISINLGIMNLLPIPGLDGSRLIFLVLEGIRGKPVPPKYESMVHAAGFILLMLLMLFLTWRDISRLLGF